MMRATRSLLVLSLLFSLANSCKDRFFDNPFDPDREERGYEIEATIPISGLIILDLAFTGDSIWLIDSFSRILSLNYNSGNVIRQLSLDTSVEVNGLCYNGIDLWLHVNATTQIIRASIINGEIIKVLNLPDASYSVMDYYEDTIYIADRFSNSIQLINPETGEVVNTLPNPGFSVDGICFDGQHLWILDNPALKLYRLNTEGKVVAVYQPPDKNPAGLSYSQGVIWCGDTSGKIFKLRFPPLNQTAMHYGTPKTDHRTY